MKVLVTGVAGQLGYDVMHELTKRGHSAIGSDIVRKEDCVLHLTIFSLISQIYRL